MKLSWLPSGAGEGEGVSPAWLSGIAATAAAVAVGGVVAAVALTQIPTLPAKRKESFLSDAAGIAKARCTSWFQPPAWEAASTSEDEECDNGLCKCIQLPVKTRLIPLGRNDAVCLKLRQKLQ